jgi:outer membrane immunogenic protein
MSAVSFIPVAQGALVNKLILGAMTFAALATAGTALAADFPLKAPVPVPFYAWTGCYIGGNVGYGGSLDESIAFTGAAQAGFFSTHQFPVSIPVNPKGVLGGGQIGCNAQFQQWVFGVETDLQASRLKVSNTLTPIPSVGPQFVTAASESRNWFGTARARVGLLAIPQALLYATGGLAYGETELSFSTRTFVNPGVNCPIIGACVAATASGTGIGWTAGAGMEWMFAGNWSAKAEYLYVDLGKHAATGVTLPNAVPPGSYTASSEFREHLARVGVNYKFDWVPFFGAY